jgi:hypothetical protein
MPTSHRPVLRVVALTAVMFTRRLLVDLAGKLTVNGAPALSRVPKGIVAAVAEHEAAGGHPVVGVGPVVEQDPAEDWGVDQVKDSQLPGLDAHGDASGFSRPAAGGGPPHGPPRPRSTVRCSLAPLGQGDQATAEAGQATEQHAGGDTEAVQAGTSRGRTEGTQLLPVPIAA